MQIRKNSYIKIFYFAVFLFFFFSFFLFFPSKLEAYKRWYACNETISDISGCTKNHSGHPEIAQSFVGSCQGCLSVPLDTVWVDIEAWDSCCATTDGCSSSWSIKIPWSFTAVQCCDNSDCGECKTCSGNNCVNVANGTSCSIGVCYNGNCYDPDSNEGACISMNTVETCSGDWCYGDGNGVYDNGGATWVWSSGSKNCCGDDVGEVPRRSYYPSCLPGDSHGNPGLGQCVDTDGSYCGTPFCTYTGSGCYLGGDYLCCAPGECADCGGCEPDNGPAPECTDGWWCDNGDFVIKNCTKANNQCSSGHCVCASGWDDCNGDGNCNCNLSGNECSGTNCVPSETDCGLRGYDGTSVVTFACEPLGTLTSPLRIKAGDGNIYGIILVNSGDSKASSFIINTTAGIRALKIK